MPTALLSVADKSGLVDLARGLFEQGWELMASGGSARILVAAGLPVTQVSEYTGSPEILGGRVKTLHPAVAGGLLARPTQTDLDDLTRIHARPIDLVAVNLYPFQEVVSHPEATLEDAIDHIDIGGATLIRAAAKNFKRVTVLIEPGDYPRALAELQMYGETTLETRRRLAEKAFAHTAAYDAVITAYLSEGVPLTLLQLYPVQRLRYGENPHQEAVLYSYAPGSGPLGGELLQGKPLSYNNLLDLDAAWRAVVAFDRPSVCIVKHLSPCGLASADTLAAAYSLALASDPVSAFGGVVATNRPFDEQIAAELGDLFLEGLIAPGFSEAARDQLQKRENLRLVSMPSTRLEPQFELRSINRGVLRQSLDQGDPPDSPWKTVTEREPTGSEWRDLRFAWLACQHVKSNAIVFARNEATVGIGGGQPNRVDCVRLAAGRAGKNARHAVMASDAFLPFPDSVDEAAKAGIRAIVQPGGSIRDEDAIASANRNDIAMVFTGVRHFRH